MIIKKNSVLLFTGGLDSLIIWFLLNKPPTIYIDLGSKYSQQEIDNILKINRKYNFETKIIKNTINLGIFEEKSAYIPLRNLFIFMIVSNLGFSYVYYGALRGEASRDKSVLFDKFSSWLISWLLGKKKKLIAPYRHLTKYELVKLFTATHDETILEDSFSCYDPINNEPCGVCVACFRRDVALGRTNINWPKPNNNWTFWELPNMIYNNLQAYFLTKRR